jgi:hypothetical protein
VEMQQKLTVIEGAAEGVDGDFVYERIAEVLNVYLPCLADDDPSWGSLRVLARACGCHPTALSESPAAARPLAQAAR